MVSTISRRTPLAGLGLFLGLVQGRLHLLALRDVADIGRQQGRLLRVQHREGQLDGELLTVRDMPTVSTRPADPGALSGGQQMSHAAAMRFPQRGRHDLLIQGLSQQIFPQIAEHLFGRGIELQNPSADDRW